MARVTNKYVIVLLWAMVSFGVAILCFYDGFFLRRRVLTSRSASCELPQNLPHCLFPGVPLCTAPNNAAFDKLIFIVIDALRFDFLNGSSIRWPEERMRNVKELVNSHPENALIGKVLADPPTTTMQRVKALTTGTFPTFIDAGANFFTGAVEEDSLLFQWRSANKSVGFVGDSTWTDMFPDAFSEAHPCSSFDITDLDTVDEMVTKKLREELTLPKFDVFIGHFLGVDHAGHRYGRGHPETARKLREMDRIVCETVENMGNSTLLVVLGDHGMTDSGDHGGDTEDETEAGLLIFSKTAKFEIIGDRFLEVSQIDLVPTLAWLTGVAMPLSNLGSVVLDVIPALERIDSTAANYLQVKAFLDNYPMTGFPVDERKTLKRLSDKISSVSCEEEGPSRLNVNQSQVTEWRREFLRLSKTMCRKAWVDFDTLSMANGLVFALLALGTWISVCLVPLSAISDVFHRPLLNLLSIGTSGIILFWLCVQCTGWLPENIAWSAIFATSCGTEALVLSNVVKHGKMLSILKQRYFPWMTIVAVVVHSCLFASNSYVVREDAVAVFFFVTFVIIETRSADVETFFKCNFKTLDSQKTKFHKQIKATRSNLLRLIIVGFSVAAVAKTVLVLFRKCREENVGCEPWITHKPTNGLLHDSEKRARVLSASAAVVIATFGSWTQTPSAMIGNEITLKGIVMRYVPWFNCFALTCFWCSFCLPKRDWAAAYEHIYLFPAYVLLSSLIASVFVLCSRRQKSIGATELFHFVSLCLFQVLCVFVGDAYMVSFAALKISLVVFARGFKPERVLALGALASVFFFATGHQNCFVSLQWESAFVFGPLSSNWASALAVLINTFAVYILVAFELFGLVMGEEEGDENEGYSERSFKVAVVYLTWLSVRLFGCAIAAAVLRRHLMVWKIFAPRFLFELVGFCVSGVFLLVGAGVGNWVRWRVGEPRRWTKLP
ncbi:unnamed protein product [Notodromas monacha]|uniref:GPI ethanolamine phosphate transferase 3 n=1 Tax=Notodromas monacha TaxID=399045 RepID=A0A7R9BLU6_9CRUS|nr:unnamed protein product [Notodromas monacha]CAG0917046.1 unnamed protein product [Notodromas monacha]